MKIQSKILLFALGPLLVLGVFVVLLSNVKINNVVLGAIEDGLRNTAISVRDTLTYADEGEYHLDKKGNFCKGEFNISKSPEIAEHIKEATDTDITVFNGDIRVMTSVLGASGNPMIGTRADGIVVEKVLKGGSEYFSSDVDVYGEKYFGYYVPLFDAEGKAVGMIFAGMPQADAKLQVMSIISLIIGIVLVMGLISAVFLCVVVRRLVKALHRGTDALEQVAQGNLDIEIKASVLKRKDEIGNITRAIMQLKTSLVSIIGTIKAQSEELNRSAAYLQDRTEETSDSISQVEKAVEEIAEGATSQAEETQNASNNVIRMGDMVEETAREAEDMSKGAQNMQRLGQEAFEILHELQRINDEARESINIVYEQTNTTNQSAQKIKEATNLITSIAEETNLLSLNASIEAARAGEQGRGFAVVASQIQKLAEQSNQSAKQIENIISGLIADSDKSVETMDVVKDIVDRQSENVVKTDTCFGEVLKGIEDSIEAINRIAEKTQEMDGARTNVVDTVQNLTAIAEENAAGTEETSASITEITNAVTDISTHAGQLKGIADKMDASMAVFKL
ncbi:MAG: methyl-accepting chemotaxis protein [Lachnospiraceae bacterium]|nr:methyl-accepting chemotaxis protein [Lachnospiraceae bacterium]